MRHAVRYQQTERQEHTDCTFYGCTLSLFFPAVKDELIAKNGSRFLPHHRPHHQQIGEWAMSQEFSSLKGTQSFSFLSLSLFFLSPFVVLSCTKIHAQHLITVEKVICLEWVCMKLQPTESHFVQVRTSCECEIKK